MSALCDLFKALRPVLGARVAACRKQLLTPLCWVAPDQLLRTGHEPAGVCIPTARPAS